MGGKKEFELILEIGHRSYPLNKKMPNGYTHKWTVFVKGLNNAKIEHCIQRVVFRLHESFDKPHREITEPPFQIKETGYAGFEIPIEIYFKNKDKQNHVVFVHDLCLLTSKPNNSIATRKIKFMNPTKDFEKCLIKSGAQLQPSTFKKERSDSPPAKRQKSSSLIPSKDMCKQTSQSQPQQQPQSQHRLPQVQSNSVSQTLNQSKHQPTPPRSQVTVKPKAFSNEFADLFGQPLLYNKQNNIKDKSSRDIVETKPATVQEQANDQPSSDLQLMQTRISCLSDCTRLQKIVDIIEEAGEWFNLTPKKFEFDLKRLDKKTLHKIERCLL